MSDKSSSVSCATTAPYRAPASRSTERKDDGALRAWHSDIFDWMRTHGAGVWTSETIVHVHVHQGFERHFSEKLVFNKDSRSRTSARRYNLTRGYWNVYISNGKLLAQMLLDRGACNDCGSRRSSRASGASSDRPHNICTSTARKHWNWYHQTRLHTP